MGLCNYNNIICQLYLLIEIFFLSLKKRERKNIKKRKERQKTTFFYINDGYKKQNN